jgi:hypothetical protein
MITVYCEKSDYYFGWTNAQTKLTQPVLSDGTGYYAYLPQWFIYGTHNFEFMGYIKSKYPDSKFIINELDRYPNNRLRNKYYTGTALSNIPFFILGHVHASMCNEPMDGYSRPYLIWINIGSIAYFLFGSLGFYLFLRRFQIDRFWILLGLMGMAFATNLSYYVNVSVPFAHVFGFATINWSLFFAKKWADTNERSAFFWLCFFLGFSFVIRPTNLLVILFIPFLFPNFRIFIGRSLSWLKYRRKCIVFGSLLFFAFIAFQLLMTHDQSGEWQLNTYSNERFDNWTNPEILNVLFSWRKGLFVYAPILFLILPGIAMLYRKSAYLTIGYLLFFVISTYVFASWWCWWYGGGLGMRVYIDFMAILFVPIVFLLQTTRILLKITCVGLMLLSSWMYQVYEFQMVNNILHYDNMNYDQFKYVFMKRDLRFSWMFHLTYDTLPQNARKLPFEERFSVNNKPLKTTLDSFDGKDFRDNPIIFFSLKKHGLDTLDTYFGTKLQLELRILTPTSNPNFFIQYFRNDTVLKQANIYMGPKVPEVNQWTKLKFDLDSKLKCNEFDSLSIIFLEGDNITHAKGLKASFYSYK